MIKKYAMADGSVLGRTGQTIRVNNADLYYEIHGTGEPLFLMHGGIETMESLYGEARELALHYRVILPERRGHGRTPDTEGPFTYAQSARDMANLMDALHIKSAHLVGYSDGAITALFMGIQFPERVKSIVSISGNYHYAGLSKKFSAKIRRLSAETFSKKEKETFGLYAGSSPDGAAHFPIVFEKVKRMWATHPKLMLKDLALISAPVLVMAADGDLVSMGHTINLYKFLPRGQLSIIAGTTHSLPIEAPDEVNRTILRFLNHQKDT